MSLPPSTDLMDVAKLGGAYLKGKLMHPFTFDAENVFRDWAKSAAVARKTENLRVNLLIKKLLLVGSADLSRRILLSPPRVSELSAGTLKRAAMGFLAPDALFISNDEEWRDRRAFNLAVLKLDGMPSPEARQKYLSHFVHCTLNAFNSPINNIADIRSAMGRAMLGVVFGGDASAKLVTEIEALFGLVQNPLKRLLTWPYAKWRRNGFYQALEELWGMPHYFLRPSLLQLARRFAGNRPNDDERRQQIPHWMFTFTGSATDLLIRTLALIAVSPSALDEAKRESDEARPIDGIGHDVPPYRFLEACLVETGHLYPPVTRTFHYTEAGYIAGETEIPKNTEIMHLFPLFTADLKSTQVPFNPGRWLSGAAQSCPFDPFLGGARACPGRDLILLVCQTALASLLRRGLAVEAPGVTPSSLPSRFPSRGLSVKII